MATFIVTVVNDEFTGYTPASLTVGEKDQFRSEMDLAKATDLSALDGEVVKKDGAQTINDQKTFSVIPRLPSYSEPNDDEEFAPKKYVDDTIAAQIGGLASMPVGATMAFFGPIANIYADWEIMQGQAKDTATHPELYAILGDHYGNPGAGQFNMPNTLGKTLLGAIQDTNVGTPNLTNGYGLGQEVGSDSHQLVTAEIPAHNHTMNYQTRFVNPDNDNVERYLMQDSYGDGGTWSKNSADKGSDLPHENRQPSFGAYMIMKVK